MCSRTNQTILRVIDLGVEGLRVVKLRPVPKDGVGLGSSPGKFRASSRGNTKGASVIRVDWA